MAMLHRNHQYRAAALLALLLLSAALLLPARSAALAPAWQPNTYYAVGQLASYNGLDYKTLQSHTSQVGWEPPNVPALWTQESGGATATPAPPTATTSQPTATTSQPTATPGSGACTAPAWDRQRVYYGGDVVSHNNREWRAEWWTQGEEPGTTGEWGVWRDRGSCDGTNPTATPQPSATATPQPTATTSPTSGPSPTATSTSVPPPPGDLPRRLLVGYWHNFDNGSTVIRLRNVSPRWDVINVAFAETAAAGHGTMQFSPFNATVEEFKADIAYLQSQGKRVLISIGGANSTVELHDATSKQNFINSMTSIIETYGFDGLDIDLEGSSLSLGSGDSDFRNPTTPKIVNLIDAVKTIDNRFGADFILTMAPETAYVQGGLIAYGGPWGAYLPVIHGLRDRLTYIHVQHYNSGSMEGLDGRSYAQGTADFQVAMAEMLLYGFPVARNENNIFPALREDQVAIGLPASSSAAGGGYTRPSEVHKALDYLVKGRSFGGGYVLRKPGGYPNFRGLMTWSINWDVVNNSEFSTNHRSYLDGLGQ